MHEIGCLFEQEIEKHHNYVVTAFACSILLVSFGHHMEQAKAIAKDESHDSRITTKYKL